MRILSVTQREGRVIELTREEFGEFYKLVEALEGQTENHANWVFNVRSHLLSMNDEVDFSGVFGAIQAFYEAQFRVNEMSETLQRFQEFLRGAK